MKWREATLGEYCDFQEGYVNPSKQHPEYFGGNIKWLRAVDLNDGYVYETSQSLTEAGFKSAGKSALLFEPNTIVISKSGTIGRLAIIKDYMCGNRATINIKPKNNACTEFIFYLLRSHQKEFVNLAVGSVQKNLYVSILEKMVFKFPELDEQKKIADFISVIDRKIENNEKINKNLEEQIEAYYRSWFVTFEQFSDALEDGELGKQPIGWKVVHLKEVTKNIRDRVKNDTDSVKVLSAINTGKLILSEEYFTKQVFSKDISNYILVEENDFAYNPARINIGSIGINDLGIRGCVSPVYVVIRTEKGYENFLRYFIRTDRFKTEVNTRASGSVRQAMNYTDFGLIKVIYPPKKVMNEFNEIVTPLQNTIKHIEKENAKLAEIRDSLLPKLMSGELDVSELEL